MTVAAKVRDKAKTLPDEGKLSMSKRELIETVAADADCTVADAEWMVEVVLDAMVRPMIRGRGLRITGFGSWMVKKRDARWARNPQTGERVRTSPYNTVTFKAGQRLKDLVNGDLVLESGGKIVTKKPKTLKVKDGHTE